MGSNLSDGFDMAEVTGRAAGWSVTYIVAVGKWRWTAYGAQGSETGMEATQDEAIDAGIKAARRLERPWNVNRPDSMRGRKRGR